MQSHNPEYQCDSGFDYNADAELAISLTEQFMQDDKHLSFDCARDMARIELNRRYKLERQRRSAETERNNNRIAEFNSRAKTRNEKHPDNPPIKYLSFEQFMLRKAGFYKALEQLKKTTTSNVIPLHAANPSGIEA
jgi:hypothetical protein